MAYVKNTWVDQAGQIRYEQTTDEDDLIILTPNYELITEIGTPVNATNMNHIENGIADCYSYLVNKTGDTMSGGLSFSSSQQGAINFTVPNQNTTSIVFKDSQNDVIGELKCVNNSGTDPVSGDYISWSLELNSYNNEGIKLTNTGNGAILTLPNTKCIDGQWVNSFHSLTTSVDIGNYEINLSSYLPNDNYSYEVMVCFAGFRSGGTTNSVVSVSDTSVTLTDGRDIANSAVYGVTEFDGDHKEAGEFSCIVVVGSSRKFYFNIARFKLGAGSLIMTKYRRIGTNS